jgi:hypothetical protein
MENYACTVAYHQMLKEEEAPVGGMGAQAGGPLGTTFDLGVDDSRVPTIVIPMMKRKLAYGGKDHQKELKKILDQMAKQHDKVEIIDEDDDVYEIKLTCKEGCGKSHVDEDDDEPDDERDEETEKEPETSDEESEKELKCKCTHVKEDRYEKVRKKIAEALGRKISRAGESVFNVLDEDGDIDYTVEMKTGDDGKPKFILNKKRIYTADDSLDFDKVVKGIHKLFVSTVDSPTKIMEGK